MNPAVFPAFILVTMGLMVACADSRSEDGTVTVCPVDGEQMSDEWTYCPDHGAEVITAARVNANIEPPKIRTHVEPVYPADALAEWVQGIVSLEAVIGSDGKVIGVEVLRSVPPLDEAAITAVKRWEYAPTLLNGQPVAVIMAVDIEFALPAVTAEALFAAYRTNRVAAELRFGGQWLVVSGRVIEIGIAPSGVPHLVLDAGLGEYPVSGVVARFGVSTQRQVAAHHVGEHVTLRCRVGSGARLRNCGFLPP